MRERETLRTYSDRYWKTYNEIDEDFKDVAVRTFKVGLPVEHELRKLLTMKTTSNMRQLMDRIDKYKRVEEDQFGHFGAKLHSGNVPRPALGTISVIFPKSRGDLGACSRVMFVGGGLNVEAVEAKSHVAKKAKGMAIPTLSFSKQDKKDTCQPHDDALVVTIRIGGYDVKRVLVDQEVE
ncbi:uncharacterized protein LOC142632364 [Castanea sativa]|uniref:uncharacterized protein LOC142632364 n=1 Tax=Castanea sativa TaxID=21020 RepID=UPI003F652650